MWEKLTLHMRTKKVHISCTSTQAVKGLFLLSKSNLKDIFEFQASNCFHLLHMLFCAVPGRISKTGGYAFLLLAHLSRRLIGELIV